MMKLTIIADGHRMVRELSPERIVSAAAILKDHRQLDLCHLTVLLEGENKVTHIICRRPPLRQTS